MELTSPAFAAGGDIPGRFTCDGVNVSPALEWTDPPEGTKSFALVVDDPDAPGHTWVHWVLFDLPPDERLLPQHIPATAELPSGARQGRNDFGRVGYGGPCPPAGPIHRYVFRLFALDTPLGAPGEATRDDVFRAMQGHVLAHAELTGRYRRR